MPAERRAIPDVGRQPADLRHQVPRVGHAPRPRRLDAQPLQLGIHAEQFAAQRLGQIGRVIDTGGDSTAPADAAAIEHPVVVAGAAVVADSGRAADGLQHPVAQRFGQHDVGGDRQHRPAQRRHHAVRIAAGGQHHGPRVDLALFRLQALDRAIEFGMRHGRIFVDPHAQPHAFPRQRASVVQRMEMKGRGVFDALEVDVGQQALADLVASQEAHVAAEVSLLVIAPLPQSVGRFVAHHAQASVHLARVFDRQVADIGADDFHPFHGKPVKLAVVVFVYVPADGVRAGREGRRHGAAVAARRPPGDTPPFQQSHPAAAPGQLQRGRQAGQPCPHHANVGAVRARQRRIVSGGIGQRAPVVGIDVLGCHDAPCQCRPAPCRPPVSRFSSQLARRSSG
ncbi:hypothetical protein D9M68_584000 [compost metagenome]